MVNPARAGMIQTLAARTGMSVRKPRASGDDPWRACQEHARAM